MVPIYLKPGVRFIINNTIYSVLKKQSNESIQVLNENFNKMCYFSYKEIVQLLVSGNLKFEVKGKNVKPPNENEISTKYTFNDLESNPYKDTIIFRYKIIEPLLKIAPAIRKRKDVIAHVDNINKLIETPHIFEKQFEIKPMKKLSVTTVYRWLQFYMESEGDIRSLSPGYFNCGGKYKFRFNDKIKKFIDDSIKERYLNNQRVTIKEIYYDIVNKVTEHNELSDYKLDYPSYPTIARKVAIIPEYKLVEYRYGKRQADTSFSQVGNGVNVEYPLERVEIDSTILDILLVDEAGSIIGRPYIVAAVDKYTRNILGFSIGFGSVGWTEVMQCIYHILTDKSYVKEKYPEIVNEWSAFGLPRTLVIDNGLAFKNNPMIDACRQLGFVLQCCPPHIPEWKGSIERFFNTTNSEFIHQMPGTTRSNPQQLSENENPSKYACLRFSLFIKLIHKWAIDVYSQDLHKGVRGIPALLWEKAIKENPVAIPSDISEIAICLGRVEFRTVTRKGIELNNLRYNSENLNKLLRKFSVENDGKNHKFKVKYNPLDLSEIFLYDHLIEKDWLRIPSVDLEYTKNLTEWEHKESVSRTLREFGSVNIEALAKARVQISREIQNEGVFTKKKDTKIKKQNLANEILNDQANLKEDYSNTTDKLFNINVKPENHFENNNISDIGTIYTDEDDKTVIVPLDIVEASSKKESLKKNLRSKNKKGLVDKKLEKPLGSEINKNTCAKDNELTEDDFRGFKIITRL